jgi:hypothetical protein
MLQAEAGTFIASDAIARLVTPFLPQRIYHDIPCLRADKNLQSGRLGTPLVAIHHDWQPRLCCDEFPASGVAFRNTKAKRKADDNTYCQTSLPAGSGSVIDTETKNTEIIEVDPVSVILQL